MYGEEHQEWFPHKVIVNNRITNGPSDLEYPFSTTTTY